MTPVPEDRQDAARDRYTVFWCAAAFAVVGVAGLELFPGGRWIWVTVIVLALTAIPQAFVSTRKPRGQKRR